MSQSATPTPQPEPVDPGNVGRMETPLTSSPLTPAETTTLQLYEAGMSQRAIALHLNISRSTVRSRLENIARKLADQEAKP